MLRGQIPQDRNPKEIKWKSIDESTDMWEHLAHNLGDERCEVLYWGGKRNVWYSEKCNVRFVKSLKRYIPDFVPDVIFSRGGFKEYVPLLKKFPKALKIYYGAGARSIPEGYTKYDLILADSPAQLLKLQQKLPTVKANLWFKPAPFLFKPMPEVKKKYDVGYVGDCRFPFRAKIKGIKLAYKVPKDLKMLHLGWSGKYKVPKNVKVKRVTKDRMPKQINKCKVVIVPYSSYDSCPRIIPEALACGVPVVVLAKVNFWGDKYIEWEEDNVKHWWGTGDIVNKKDFWDRTKQIVMNMRCDTIDYRKNLIFEYYKKYLSMPVAVEHLRRLINGSK